MLNQLLNCFRNPTREFTRRFTPLQHTLLDPETTFSGSAMFNDLSALEPLARRCGEHSEQLAQLYDSLSRLQSKRGLHEDTSDYAIKALNIHTHAPCFDAESVFYLNYRIFRALDEEGEFEQALPYMRTCIEQIESPWLEVDSRLGLREEFGRVLHDTGLFSEALELNLQLLQTARQHLGAENPALCGLLNNLAQNLYELQQLKDAETYLQERLNIARHAEDHDIEADTLFQLGVLKFEQGQKAEAYKLFEERIRRAQEVGDEYLIHAAEEAMEELRSRDEAGNT